MLGDEVAKFVGLQLPPDLVKRINDWAKRQKIDQRSEALRELIERGLRYDADDAGAAPRAC